ncbi:MAG: hypothetical protein Q9181_004280, partial [Wetmoreana brouardii]
MFLSVALLFISTFPWLLQLALAAPATPVSHVDGIQLVSDYRNISISAPHQLGVPPDPSLYRIGDTLNYIMVRGFGQRIVQSDAKGVLDDALEEVNGIIASSRDPDGGRVLHNYQWVHGTVRFEFNVLGRPIGFMDFELLKEYLEGAIQFSESHGGYWQCEMVFLFKRGRSYLQVGKVFLTIE